MTSETSSDCSQIDPSSANVRPYDRSNFFLISRWFTSEIKRSRNWTSSWPPQLHLCTRACRVGINSGNLMSGPWTKDWNFTGCLAWKFTRITWLINKTFSSSNGIDAGDFGNAKFFMSEYHEKRPTVWKSTTWFSSVMSLRTLHHHSNR